MMFPKRNQDSFRQGGERHGREGVGEDACLDQLERKMEGKSKFGREAADDGGYSVVDRPGWDFEPDREVGSHPHRERSQSMGGSSPRSRGGSRSGII